MKTIIIIFLISLISVNANEVFLQGTVSNVVMADKSPFKEEKICVTFIENKGETIGIIEDIRQCYFAQKYKNNIGEYIELNEKNNFLIQDHGLIELLEEFNPNTKFLILDFE
ncbi:MAG: hypothetical protein HOJ35_03160 [Bdellovibrionales bacterium]|jgi:hypothetical protein|nr:hypothetical protein [Bdellovibrionales bacterium]